MAYTGKVAVQRAEELAYLSGGNAAGDRRKGKPRLRSTTAKGRASIGFPRRVAARARHQFPAEASLRIKSNGETIACVRPLAGSVDPPAASWTSYALRLSRSSIIRSACLLHHTRRPFSQSNTRIVAAHSKHTRGLEEVVIPWRGVRA